MSTGYDVAASRPLPARKGLADEMPDGMTAVFIGDSITDAGRRSDPSGFLGAGYVRRLKEMADEREAPLRIINSGVSGDRIREMRRRWQQDCLAHRPDIVTVLIGVNDTCRRFDAGQTTSAEEYTEDYRAILGSAVAAGVTRLVVMEPFLVPVNEDQVQWRVQDLDLKIDASRTVAAEYGASLVPLDGLMNAEARVHGPLSVVGDGVHPSARGHQLIADGWWSVMADHLAVGVVHEAAG